MCGPTLVVFSKISVLVDLGMKFNMAANAHLEPFCKESSRRAAGVSLCTIAKLTQDDLKKKRRTWCQ